MNSSFQCLSSTWNSHITDLNGGKLYVYVNTWRTAITVVYISPYIQVRHGIHKNKNVIFIVACNFHNVNLKTAFLKFHQQVCALSTRLLATFTQTSKSAENNN